MQLKKAIKSIILPAMERNGYTLIDSDTAYYEFGINDDSLRVVVDKNPWPPAELRVSFCYRNHRYRFSHFHLDRLAKYKDIDLFYKSQEELELKLNIIANILETDALSLLVSIRDNHVFWGEEMDLLYLVNPKKQAANYAKNKLLTMSFELSNFIFLENQIRAIRGDIMCKWRQNFEMYSDETIGLTSYYGEIIRRRDKAKWDAGVLVYDQGRRYPNFDVVDYWNYGLFMPAVRIVPPNLLFTGEKDSVR